MWLDNAEADKTFNLIPDGTCALAKFYIRPGSYNQDDIPGCVKGWATQSQKTDSVYLKVEYVILNGKYKKQRIFDLVGLYSPKDKANAEQGKATFAGMGKNTLARIMRSSTNCNPDDKSPQTLALIAPQDEEDPFSTVYGRICVIEIGVKSQPGYSDKNYVKKILLNDHSLYSVLFDGIPDESVNLSSLDLDF